MPWGNINIHSTTIQLLSVKGNNTCTCSYWDEPRGDKFLTQAKRVNTHLNKYSGFKPVCEVNIFKLNKEHER